MLSQAGNVFKKNINENKYVQSGASSVRGLGAHGSGTPGARLMSQLTLSRLLRDSNRFTDRRARALRHSKPRAASRASSFAV